MKKDMHVHSNHSRDGVMEVPEILRIAKERGLDGVAITDHNTIAGGLEGLKISQDYGIQVTVGAEVKTDQGEVIGYHINHEIESTGFYDVIDEIKRQGGVVSIPHAFDALRSSAVNSEKLLVEFKDQIDYLEVNGRTLPYFNNKARAFAQEHGIPVIGGSDAHMPWEIGNTYTVFDDGTKVVGNGSVKALYPLVRTKIYKIFRI
ncbi:MAG: PHP domain-containing protein [Candidatus Altiarchaeota archaeon]